MSSLSSLLNGFNLIKGHPEDMKMPLSWPRDEVLVRLEYCSSIDIENWHQTQQPLIKAQENQDLEELCNIVATCLVRATNRAKLLENIIKGHGAKVSFKITDRMLLAWTITEVEKALKLFEAVCTTPKLARPNAREVELRYLEQAYRMMMVLAPLVFCFGSDYCAWFTECLIYLQETELMEFEFDLSWDHWRGQNRTLVILPHNLFKLLEKYPPANSHHQVFYPTVELCGTNNFYGYFTQDDYNGILSDKQHESPVSDAAEKTWTVTNHCYEFPQDDYDGILSDIQYRSPTGDAPEKTWSITTGQYFDLDADSCQYNYEFPISYDPFCSLDYSVSDFSLV